MGKERHNRLFNLFKKKQDLKAHKLRIWHKLMIY